MTRVLVGLSGGVDSAVAAYLLLQQGYEVVGGFMKNYVSETGNCTTYDDAEQAIKVAKFLGIELIAFDLQKEYQTAIIDYIYAGYKQGITPNPDVLCNSLIKFAVFLDKARELGFDKIATGHYAKIEEIIHNDTPEYHLLRGLDKTKDQSYFLSGLNQYQLSYALFPLGDIPKKDVRAIAKEIGLPNAERKDSQGLCFIGNVPMRDFLAQKFEKKIGNIVTSDGKIVGTHDGAWSYTRGQRHGLKLNFKAYVLRVDIEKNEVIVGEKDDQELISDSLVAHGRHWIGQSYTLPLEVKTKIRYRQEPQSAQLVSCDNGRMKIVFPEAQRAIAPGQVVVAYLGEECIGSGIIEA